MAGSLMVHFKEMDDPRRDQGKRHPLVSIIGIAIIGVICGADDWTEVQDVARAKREWLQTFLDLPHGIPSHDTIGRVFSLLDPRAFERCLVGWVRHVAELTHRQLIALDGKTVRRSYDTADGKAALHMVSAWCRANHLVLGQLATDLKENEITAIPRLLELLDLRGAVVTIDAAGCQKSIASKILDGGGDYLLQVKANHPSLLEDLSLFFEDASEHRFEDTPHAKAQSPFEKDHGRLEQRTLWAVWDLAWLKRHHDWPGLKSVICLEAHGERAGKPTRERRYYISSLDGRDAQALLNHCRGHWGIENSLHWSLDVCFNEDQSRVRLGHAQENLAAIRRAALGLLKQEKSFKGGLKRKRRRCAMDQKYLRAVLR